MPPEKSKTVTIADVAREAQVSTATVSLVVNGQASSLRISEATRQSVLEAVRRLGYTPNHAARSLRRGKAFALALLITQVDIPYHGELATAAVAAAETQGYDVLIMEARSPDHEVRLLERLRGGRVDGALVATMRSPFDSEGRPVLDALARRNEARVALAQSGTPVVALLDRSPDPSVPAVRVDNEEGAYQSTRHLVDLGHQRIAHMTIRSSPPAEDEQTASADRYRGYRRALAEAGLAYTDDLLLTADHGRRLPSGYEAGLKWQRLASGGVTAGFISNDLLAVGVLRGLHDAAVRVPEDLALSAFDGIELSRYTRPSLTTVEHPRTDLGRIGAETLIGLVEGRQPDERERVLPTHLVVRESSGGPVSGWRATPVAATIHAD
ncbi:MAG: LacI family DNA-binding transcriptional regulator [Chloroflexi bacterium]|nr:LacI family DNA-binding transcriptional regulator [Chloroflexota bacterium]